MFSPLDVASGYFVEDRLDESEAVCLYVLRETPEDVRALGLMAGIANRRGEYDKALALADYAIAVGGESAILLVEKAHAHFRLDQPAEAEAAARQAVALSPDVPGGYALLAEITLPGDDYIEHLRRFHEELRPRNYLEIGVDTGRSLALALPPTVAVGVDPKPRLNFPPQTLTTLVPLTSDAYFADRDISAPTIDLAFIDGGHLFEIALRDFINVERHASSDTVVLMHDCLPMDRVTRQRERTTAFWSGDVWKVIPALRKWRPDLEIFTIPCKPTGLAVIQRLDQKSHVLADNFDAIVAAAPTEPDADALRQSLALVENDWGAVRTRLGR